jgi:hydrogenase maturation protein HypF
MVAGAYFFVSGIVQGVGFRPFIYNLAQRLSLYGWVRNTSSGVEIEVEGDEKSLDDFYSQLMKEAPPLAIIDQLNRHPIPVKGYTDFKIFHSSVSPEAFQPISPDISICPDCLHELFDPANRRYRYPFINCTNCGPRFTIINDIPYDRPNTTMAGFELCPECKTEYDDPSDRRFHAQPIACPTCGPHVWLEGNTHTVLFNHDEAIREAQKLLQQGKIIAIKGLGGFHIACDATNEDAVELLRKRKLRVDKPFAVMVPDISTARKHCSISEEEQTLLQSRTRPIVILNRLSESSIVDQIAPNQQTVGVMLPYTPLHYLLLSDSSGDNLPISNILVMTSGNLSEEPIAYDNEQARLQLSSLVDYFLMHNRPIETRCDDSVTRILPKNKGIQFSRRSRGYAPNPILVPWSLPQILATGAELKNTFCMTRENYAFISHHIGDLENYETFQSFEEGINNYQQLFRLTPEAIAYDLHPNYLSTQYALEQAATHNYPAIGVQHHHAHIAACMAENQIPPSTPVIGISFDGTGYGTDSAIWGGEILIADYCSFERYSHIKYYRLPGGDMAIRNPSRIAIAYLLQSGIDLNNPFPPILATKSNQLDALKSQLTHHINTPSTSSMGRLFDAVAALIGVRQSINYEAQAAIELESLVDSNETSSYAFDFYDEKQDISLNQNNTVIIDPVPVLNNIAADYLDHHPLPIISAKFHNGIANMVVSICAKIRDQRGITDVVLSGGVWQNQTLLLKTIACLEENNFNAIIHHKLPPNDGSISFGQAMIVYHQLNRL